MYYLFHDPVCPCAPCSAKELERHESYILDHTPIAAKIEKRFVDEFRRLVSIAPDLTFTERLIELDAFSASTACQQRELVHRFAVEAREAQLEECMAVGDELDELDEIIEATEPLGAPLELARTA